jgi:hypothetical protein
MVEDLDLIIYANPIACIDIEWAEEIMCKCRGMLRIVAIIGELNVL